MVSWCLSYVTFQSLISGILSSVFLIKCLSILTACDIFDRLLSPAITKQHILRERERERKKKILSQRTQISFSLLLFRYRYILPIRQMFKGQFYNGFKLAVACIASLTIEWLGLVGYFFRKTSKICPSVKCQQDIRSLKKCFCAMFRISNL